MLWQVEKIIKVYCAPSVNSCTLWLRTDCLRWDLYTEGLLRDSIYTYGQHIRACGLYNQRAMAYHGPSLALRAISHYRDILFANRRYGIHVFQLHCLHDSFMYLRYDINNHICRDSFHSTAAVGLSNHCSCHCVVVQQDDNVMWHGGITVSTHEVTAPQPFPHVTSDGGRTVGSVEARFSAGAAARGAIAYDTPIAGRPSEDHRRKTVSPVERYLWLVNHWGSIESIRCPGRRNTTSRDIYHYLHIIICIY